MTPGSYVHDNRTYLVRLKSGVVIPHTKAEYERYMKGVDEEAAELLWIEGSADDGRCDCGEQAERMLGGT